MRKGRRRRRQKRERDPEEDEETVLTEGRIPGGEIGVIASRLARFPGLDVEKTDRELGVDEQGLSYGKSQDQSSDGRSDPNVHN